MPYPTLTDEETQYIARYSCGDTLTEKQVDEMELRAIGGLIQMLCSGWAKHLSPCKHNILAIFTKKDACKNAWAFDSFSFTNRHLVAFSTELVDSLSRYAGQIPRIVEFALASTSGVDRLRSVWGELPNDPDHRTAFAELLLHAAIVFLTLHEIAHIGLGHVAHFPRKAGSTPQISEMEAFHGEWNQSSMRSQALELDADIHALEWMREYFQLNQQKLVSGARISQGPAQDVWTRFIGADSGIRFLVIAGAWLSLLALDPKPFHPRQLRSGSHPVGAMRMAVLVHLENEASRRRTGAAQSIQLAAAEFAMTTYASVSLTEFQLRELEIHGNKNALKPIREPMEVAKRNSGLAGVLGCWNAVGAAANKLASERSKLESALAKTRRLSSKHLVQWFPASTVVGG